MNKLIVFGVNIQNTLGLIRSIGEKGIPVILLLEPCMKGTCYVKYSKYLKKIHYLKSTEEGLDVLKKEYWNESVKPILLFGGDPPICLLDKHYDELKDHFALFNAGTSGRINFFMDKINTFPVAEESGITTINTWYVTDIHNLPDDITFPCLTKGNNSTGSTKHDMYVCKNREELVNCLREGVEYLIQEYIVKEYEVNAVGLSYNHGKNIFLPAVVRKIRDEIHRQSVYIRLDDVKDYPTLDLTAIQKFVEAIGYEGIFSVEFIHSQDKYYFLEINMRNDGCGYLYTAAGINYPYLWVLYNQGKLTQDVLESIKFKTPYYLMHEDDMYNMFEGVVSVGQWLKECIKADAYFIMNWRDPMPFIVSTWIHIRQACKMVLRKVFKINIR